jgi:hypothetical protein
MIATSRVRDYPGNPGWRFLTRVVSPIACHSAGRHQASAIGAHYRHTTPDMAARVVTAVEQRLVIVLAKAEAALDQQLW